MSIRPPWAPRLRPSLAFLHMEERARKGADVCAFCRGDIDPAELQPRDASRLLRLARAVDMRLWPNSDLLHAACHNHLRHVLVAKVGEL